MLARMDRTDDESQAIAKARLLMAAVDRRARKCPAPICRRNRRCMADPAVERNFHDRTGGCPVTTRAEWAGIKLGLQASLSRVIDAAEAIMRVTGETFEEVRKRLLVRHPLDARERRVLMDLWRR